jgi:hypothetical protein
MLSVTGVETALACSENEPTTSSEISVSPIDNSDPIQFNKRSLSDEDRLKLLKTKWIPSSNSYIEHHLVKENNVTRNIHFPMICCSDYFGYF